MGARPYVIGLTGGIASGKNAVADMLERRGATVVDADRVSREVMGPGSPILATIAAIWGADVVTPEGALDRATLASRVFGNDEEVRRLNDVTHPAILAEMKRQADAALTPFVVFMAPLLFEAGGERLVDEIWVAAADEAVRVRRILARDAISEAQARARMAAQVPPAEAKARAHVVIENNGDLADTERQVENAWQAVRARAALRGA